MPFQSKEQEDFMRINLPKIWREWVKKYGRFRSKRKSRKKSKSPTRRVKKRY